MYVATSPEEGQPLKAPDAPPGLGGEVALADMCAADSDSDDDSDGSAEDPEKDARAGLDVFRTFDPFGFGTGSSRGVTPNSTIDVFKTFDPWGVGTAKGGGKGRGFDTCPTFDAFTHAQALNHALNANAAALAANAEALNKLASGGTATVDDAGASGLPGKPPGVNHSEGDEDMPPGMQSVSGSWPLMPLPFPSPMMWPGAYWPTGYEGGAESWDGAVVPKMPKASKKSKATAAAKAVTTAPKESAKEPVDDTHFTTVMLRSLPKDLSREDLLQLLHEKGFEGKYDFLYMPTDFKSWITLGYAFLNLATPEDAKAARLAFQDLQWPGVSAKVCDLKWCDHQGTDILVERFRNSAVMHSSVPDLAKPIMFENGEIVPFPAPTKVIKMPRCVSYEKRANHCPRRTS